MSRRSSSPEVSVDEEWAEERRAPSAPAHRLLVAVVRRAVWDFVLYRDEDPKKSHDRYQLAEDAAGWLWWDGEEEIDEEGRYTFRFICETLDLDPKAVRKYALSLTREDIQRLNNNIKED